MQPNRDHHRVRAPAVQLAHNSQARHVAQGRDVRIRPFQRRAIVEHQEHARDRLDQEQKKRHAPHAPGEAQRDPLLFDRHRVQVQKEVGEHHHHAVAAIDRRGVPENALPNLRFADDFAERCH